MPTAVPSDDGILDVRDREIGYRSRSTTGCSGATCGVPFGSSRRQTENGESNPPTSANVVPAERSVANWATEQTPSPGTTDPFAPSPDHHSTASTPLRLIVTTNPSPTGPGVPTTRSCSGTIVIQSPGPVRDRIEVDGDDPPLGCIERGRSDQASLGGEHQVVAGVDIGDQGVPLTRRSVEQVLIAAAPSDHRVDQQVAPIGRELDLGPDLWRRVFGPHDRIVGGRLSERVMVHRSVVLIALRVAGVEKPDPSRSQATLAARQFGISSASSDPSAERTSRRTEFSVPPSLIPTATSSPSVDGKNQSTATAASCDSAAGSIKSDRRPPGSDNDRTTRRGLLLAGAAFEQEQPITADPHRLHDGQVHEFDQTGVPCTPGRHRVERCPRAGILLGDPSMDRRVVAVLQPSVRVMNLDAVQHVDDIMTLRVDSLMAGGHISQPYAITTVRTVEIALIHPVMTNPEQKNAAGCGRRQCDGRAGGRRVSWCRFSDPCWGACHDSPCCGASWPSSSRSSST